MANNRISTQEIAEILIKNIGKLEQTNIAIEKTANRVAEQIKTVSKSALRVEKPDISEMQLLTDEFNQIQHKYIHQNKSLLNEITALKTKNNTRLPNPLIYTLIGFSLLCIGFVFITYKIDSHNQLKEITKERDYYLKVLNQIPKKERDKYLNNLKK
jgi:hypothetical protein